MMSLLAKVEKIIKLYLLSVSTAMLNFRVFAFKSSP